MSEGFKKDLLDFLEHLNNNQHQIKLIDEILTTNLNVLNDSNFSIVMDTFFSMFDDKGVVLLYFLEKRNIDDIKEEIPDYLEDLYLELNYLKLKHGLKILKMKRSRTNPFGLDETDLAYNYDSNQFYLTILRNDRENFKVSMDMSDVLETVNAFIRYSTVWLDEIFEISEQDFSPEIYKLNDLMEQMRDKIDSLKIEAENSDES